MTSDSASAARQPIRIERTYQAPVEDLWDLWTTKEGLEAWWGPEGFRIEVHKLDLRLGGELVYDMIAVGAEQVAYMERSGMGVRHGTHGTFVEIEPLRRLKVLYMIDFIPGVEPYENNIQVEFFPEAESVRMVVTVDAHPDEHWTRRATIGFESQLTKLPAALAARRA